MSAAETPSRLTTSGLVGSVSRALKVLEIVAAAGDGIPAKAVARRAGLKLSTTYHLLHTLVHEGYLVRLEDARGYGLGYKVLELHHALRQQLIGSERASSALNAAHQAIGVPVYLCVFRADHIVIAEVADSPQAPRKNLADAGFDRAAHASAYGKVLLAHLSDDARREYLASAGMPKLTENTITRVNDLENELAVVRASGMATDTGEVQADLACVAAPVRDATGEVVAAVATGSPTAHFARNRERMLAAVRTAAAAI